MRACVCVCVSYGYTHLVYVCQVLIMTWFLSFSDAFAAAVQLFAHVLSSLFLFLTGPFAYPQKALPIRGPQKEGIIRV